MKKIGLIVIILIVFACFGVILKKIIQPSNHLTVQQKGGNMKLTTVFANNEKIPSKYTCDGEDLAPELTISEVPKSSKELVLIVDDPDAPMGTWVHWLLYNIPVQTTKIDNKNLPSGVKQGLNDFKRFDWGGPCPPYGEHRYFFKLYAIDKTLDLEEGATKAKLEAAIKGHIIEEAELIGLYQRK